MSTSVEKTGTTPARRAPRAKPQDRLPKKADVAADEPLTATINGHAYVVQAEVFDDFELLDDIGQMDNGDPTKAPSVIRRLLGDIEYRNVLELLRDKKTGRVPLEPAFEFTRDLLEQLDPNS